jgi:MFS family permease
VSDDHTSTTAASIAGAPAYLAPSVRHRIFLYIGFLIVLLAFGAPSGGLIDIPITFFLKNKLHLEAHELAEFRLLSAIPLYLSFVFGFIRDTWNPFGMKDRGFLLLFGLVTAGLYLLFAFTSVTFWTLLLAVVLLTTSYLFIASAQNGLSSTIGQQHAMSGQVSAVWNIFISIPTVVSLLIGGGLSERLEHTDADRAGRILFLVGAAIMAAIAAYAVWKPESVFANIRSERESSTHPLADLKRLARHRPIYPALLIWLLWNSRPARRRHFSTIFRTRFTPRMPSGGSGTRSSPPRSFRHSWYSVSSAVGCRCGFCCGGGRSPLFPSSFLWFLFSRLRKPSLRQRRPVSWAASPPRPIGI